MEGVLKGLMRREPITISGLDRVRLLIYTKGIYRDHPSAWA